MRGGGGGGGQGGAGAIRNETIICVAVEETMVNHYHDSQNREIKTGHDHVLTLNA